MKFPSKKREMQNNHMDSTIWNDLVFRDDDIVISTYAKSGTTWLQQIVGQLIFEGREDVDVAGLSPWLDLRAPPKEIKLPEVEAQTNRRFLKTHLPVDALVYSEIAKYVYVARDGRDVVWSFYNHHKNANDQLFSMLNDTPGLVGDPFPQLTKDVVEYFEEWLERDGYPLWSYWDNIRSWWKIRDLPNLHMMHYTTLKADTRTEVETLAAFLDIDLTDAVLSDVLDHSSFEYMKGNADKMAPLGGTIFKGGGKTFINKGTNGRWQNELPPELSDRYESTAIKQLGEDCAHWLKTGKM